jgi:hypothetical protein
MRELHESQHGARPFRFFVGHTPGARNPTLHFEPRDGDGSGGHTAPLGADSPRPVRQPPPLPPPPPSEQAAAVAAAAAAATAAADRVHATMQPAPAAPPPPPAPAPPPAGSPSNMREV